MRTFACLLICLVLGAAEPAGGPSATTSLFTDQEWSAAQRTSQPVAPPGTGSVVVLVIGLVVVVGLAVGLGWLVKRVNAKRLLGGKGRNLEVLETIPLGPRRQLALVRCGAHWLVIGLGERELVAVATLPAPGEAAQAPAPVAGVPAAPSAFASELSRLIAVPKP